MISKNCFHDEIWSGINSIKNFYLHFLSFWTTRVWIRIPSGGVGWWRHGLSSERNIENKWWKWKRRNL